MTRFLEKAELCKPRLLYEEKEWTQKERIKAGESQLFDLCEHMVGYVNIAFSFAGAHPDAPAYLKVDFYEHIRESEEDAASYTGWLSKGWIQEEIVHIDEFPQTLSFSRRYAFRYVKITALALSASYDLIVDHILVKTVTSARERLSPCGNTEIEKRIDQAAMKTLSECMQTEFEDGPKRDRRLWLGDLRLQALTNYQTFRHNDLVKRCLYLFAGTAMEDGRLCQSVFTKPKVEGDGATNFDYPLLFVPALLDYYEATNDIETIEELLPTALRQVECARSQFDGDLIRDGKMGWCFLDWSFELNRQAGAQAVYIYAEKALTKLLTICGRNAEEYISDIEKKSARAVAEFYDVEKKLFVSGKERQISYASNIWAVLAGLLEKEESAALVKRLKNCKEAVKPVTPYLFHHYVQALIDGGLEMDAELEMCKYWGGMIERGADTFWELFNPENPDETPYGGAIIHSYCHAWSCTPGYFLRKYFIKR